MLTISHLALALPRATAFTNFRRRFQPRVVLRGTGTEQLGAVAAPGVKGFFYPSTQLAYLNALASSATS